MARASGLLGLLGSPRAPLWVYGLLGLAWRLYLLPRFYGWEESDYGNLAMIRGVLESGFTRFDMNHMPLYYALGAAVMALCGDAVLASRLVSLVGGLAALLLAVGLAGRLGGRAAAWWAGALLLLQPELALYSASALREPVYAALLLGAVAALGSERPVLAGLLGGLSFLVRFEAALVLVPLFALAGLARPPPRARRLLGSLLPLLLAVCGWALYCWRVHGTWRFWGHAVASNLEAGERLGGEWWLHGLSVAGALAFRVLPGHMGPLLPLAGLLGLAGLRGRLGRSLGLGALLLTGTWLGTGLVGQHDPAHNLYWKWLLALVPFWGVLAGLGMERLRRALRPAFGPLGALLLLFLGLGLHLSVQLRETHRQLARSVQLYRPQLELARWIERELPESLPLVLDNIPACYLERRDNDRRLWSWMDIPVKPGDREAFGRWLRAQGIGWVLWFREDWTQAPVVAPYLAAGGEQRLGPVLLREEAREDAYGWIWYRVLPAARSTGGAAPGEVVDGPPGGD